MKRRKRRRKRKKREGGGGIAVVDFGEKANGERPHGGNAVDLFYRGGRD
jgi:hypothetical protein